VFVEVGVDLRQPCGVVQEPVVLLTSVASASIWSNTLCSMALTPPQACLGQIDVSFAV
jgi:hypothetical protein